MALLKKYDFSGQEIAGEELRCDLEASPLASQSIKDYLVAVRNNARQWSANTRNRALVNHSGKKPHRQKGTGMARQGYLGAPQYKGGGRVHTPKPKFGVHVKINRKERQAALRQLLLEKVVEGRVHLLRQGDLEAPKTKRASDFLKHAELFNQRVLFLTTAARDHAALMLSFRNIAKVRFVSLSSLGGYDVALSGHIVLLEEDFIAFKDLLQVSPC